MSTIQHPSRLKVYSPSELFYPRELTELDGKLYITNDDGSTTILNDYYITKIQDATGVVLGYANPKAAATITIPNASETRRGMVIFSQSVPKPPSSIGSPGSSNAVSRADHVHPLQTTISGNANSATKLATPRNINVSGALVGTAQKFDGTADISIPIISIDGSKITGIIPLSSIPKGAQERFYVVTNDTARLGLTINEVQNGDVVKVESTGLMYYVADDTKLGAEAAFSIFKAGEAASIEWVNVQNKPIFAAVATSGAYKDLSGLPTIYQPSSTIPKPDGVAAIGTSLAFARADHVHPLQTTISGNAATATQATQDSEGQNIANTYIKSLSVSGKTITYTKGDGTTGTIITQDTTYNLNSFGITATAAELNILKGATITVADLNKLSGLTTSAAELNHLHGVTSPIQTQLDSKAPSNHTHGKIDVNDLRDIDLVPNYFSPKSITSFFSMTGMPTAVWYAGINVNGWTSDYNSWQLVANSSNDNSNGNLYLRTGKGSTWNGWKVIIDSENIKNHSVGSAIKATNDSKGQLIANTYIKSLSVSGKTITYTKGDGTTGTIITQDTTYGVATQTSPGLMSIDDKKKLDGLGSSGDYVLPTAGLNLGGVKTTSNVTDASGYTACPIIGGIVYYKDTNTMYNLNSFGISSSATELNYTSGVTAPIQSQLNSKAPTAHSHSTLFIEDTRSDNKTPEWYMSTYGKNTITEFKSGSSIGLGSSYVSLTTIIPWTDSSGGYPKQIAFDDSNMYFRVGNSNSTWGGWNTVNTGNLTSLGITASTTELNVLKGVTATTNEINILHGLTSNTTELNYVKGVTSPIQAQLNNKATTTTYNATISTSWSGSSSPYTQTININGITANDNPIVDIIPSTDYTTAKNQLDDYEKIYNIVTNANSITVYAYEKTTTDLLIQLKCIR